MMQDHQRTHSTAASLIPAQQVSKGVELMCIYHQQTTEERTNGAWKLQISFKVDVQSSKQKQYINAQSVLTASLAVMKLGCAQRLVNCAFLNT
jgi:3-methyladenine DNA glycosylase Mpg